MFNSCVGEARQLILSQQEGGLSCVCGGTEASGPMPTGTTPQALSSHCHCVTLTSSAGSPPDINDFVQEIFLEQGFLLNSVFSILSLIVVPLISHLPFSLVGLKTWETGSGREAARQMATTGLSVISRESQNC